MDRSLRVLAVVAGAPSEADPGRGVFVMRQVESLRALGHHVDVWVLRSRVRELKYLSGALAVSGIVRRGGYDLVHAHYGNCGLVARAQWRVPVVVSFMGGDLLDARTTGQRRSRLEPLIGRAVARMVDAAIVKSEEMRATIPRSTAFVIPNGVDMELFRPIDRAAARRQLGLAPNRPYVAFVGDPARPEKDFALARAALERVTERLPEAELLVVHGQPVECVVLALNAADALVLTSYFEGSPNAVKEAMACNLPVVSVDVGDVRRVIGGTPGCHVCRRAADDLGDRLAEVLSVRERTAGRAAIAHLSQSAIARQVERVYDYVLVRRASGEVSPP